MKIDSYLSPCTKLKYKWIKDFNIKPATLKFIEEKMGSILERIVTLNHFLNIIPAAQTLRETINKWDLLKLKSFCEAKDIVSKKKQQRTKWENIFTNTTSDRVLISKIYKELKKLDTKRSHNPI